MNNKIKVIIYGCGIMGRKVAEALYEKESFEIVGAIDINPDLAGLDLGDIFDKSEKTGIYIERDAEALFSKVSADAAVLTTISHLKKVFPQIVQCMKAGLNVISTCEELSFPWKREVDLKSCGYH